MLLSTVREFIAQEIVSCSCMSLYQSPQRFPHALLRAASGRIRGGPSATDQHWAPAPACFRTSPSLPAVCFPRLPASPLVLPSVQLAGGHGEGPSQALNNKGRQRASKGDAAVLSSALHSSLFACDILPVLRARLLHLCVWGNTWPDSGLVNPEGLMLCSHFLLLLSPAVASQGHSSSVTSTCN